MPLSDEAISNVADALFRAEAGRSPIAPLTGRIDGLSLPDAYRIQLYNADRALQSGRVATGKKIGLTSKAMQQLIGVDQPDFGFLFADMEAAGGNVLADRLIQPKAEGEIAFILGDDLTMHGQVGINDVLAATAWIVPAIEIVDSRIKDWKIGILDTVADNGSSAMYVLGRTRVGPRDIDLVAETMELYVNGEKRNGGSGADVLGHPAACVAWLANALRVYGSYLRAGDVILSGAISAAQRVGHGDVARAVFGTLGDVEARFV